jgi:hypothetical protein
MKKSSASIVSVFWTFGFGICFEFRYSNFELIAKLDESIYEKKLCLNLN